MVSNRVYRERKANNLCVKCGKPNDYLPNVNCKTCSIIVNKYNQEYKQTKSILVSVVPTKNIQKNKVCLNCGNNPPKPKSAICEECSQFLRRMLTGD